MATTLLGRSQSFIEIF